MDDVFVEAYGLFTAAIMKEMMGYGGKCFDGSRCLSRWQYVTGAVMLSMILDEAVAISAMVCRYYDSGGSRW